MKTQQYGTIVAELVREVHHKGTVYAWSSAFLDRLRTAAEIDPTIVVEAFPAPRHVDGLYEPPIGLARVAAQ